MSHILRLVILLSICGLAFIINAKQNDWFYRSNIVPYLEQQSIIDQDLNQKLNDLQQTVEYLEFSLDVNNKLVEELLSEQIQKKRR